VAPFQSPFPTIPRAAEQFVLMRGGRGEEAEELANFDLGTPVREEAWVGSLKVGDREVVVEHAEGTALAVISRGRGRGGGGGNSADDQDGIQAEDCAPQFPVCQLLGHNRARQRVEPLLEPHFSGEQTGGEGVNPFGKSRMPGGR
jgi:hypothetical protein